MTIVSDATIWSITYDRNLRHQLRLELARIINYDHNCSFIVLATVITIVNYNNKTFIVQATGGHHLSEVKLKRPRLTSFWFYGIFKKCGLTCKIGSKNVKSIFLNSHLSQRKKLNYTWGHCYKTFYFHNLQNVVINQSVCPWQAIRV